VGSSSTGDRHAIMVNSSTCELYELFDAHYSSSGSAAGSGAMWSLTSDALRPASWTSADAAGLPILPLLVNYDQVASATLAHAIRVTAACTADSYLWPARHQAGQSGTSCPPMGARFRLNAGFNLPSSQCSSFLPDGAHDHEDVRAHRRRQRIQLVLSKASPTPGGPTTRSTS